MRIGTRNSPLARWQAQWVADALAARGSAVELVPIVTGGDTDQLSPLGQIGTVGVFTKELQRALLDGRIDVAVHSLKDLPTDVIEGLTIAAVPARESVRDVLVSRGDLTLEKLPIGSRIGTGSLRRQSQLLHLRPDLQVAAIRGNVDTRLSKLAAGEYQAIVLAEAGLRRLGLEERISQLLGPPDFLPAVGQGALGLETLVDSSERNRVAALDDPPSHAAVSAERSLLAALTGGCLAPIRAWGRLDSAGTLSLDCIVLSADGRRVVRGAIAGAASEAIALGSRLAMQLLDQGAGELISAARSGSA